MIKCFYDFGLFSLSTFVNIMKSMEFENKKVISLKTKLFIIYFTYLPYHPFYYVFSMKREKKMNRLFFDNYTSYYSKCLVLLLIEGK